MSTSVNDMIVRARHPPTRDPQRIATIFTLTVSRANAPRKCGLIAAYFRRRLPALTRSEDDIQILYTDASAEFDAAPIDPHGRVTRNPVGLGCAPFVM